MEIVMILLMFIYLIIFLGCRFGTGFSRSKNCSVEAALRLICLGFSFGSIRVGLRTAVLGVFGVLVEGIVGVGVTAASTMAIFYVLIFYRFKGYFIMEMYRVNINDEIMNMKIDFFLSSSFPSKLSFLPMTDALLQTSKPIHFHYITLK